MPDQPTPVAEVTVADEDGTRAVAAALGNALAHGDIVALQGTLGAGKTAFARALINALPGDPEDVPSPTFTLVQTYTRGTLEIWHFDLYRLEDPDEAFELGIEDAFADAVSLIEWPDRLGTLLPARHLLVNIDEAGRGRRFAFSGNTAWRGRLAGIFEGISADG
jgi:tRNA threonylcarbamoyladenosine biosynthesis protein TsaE